jgi:hypothetical protein
VTKRVCPACARRTSELVEPSCPVCRGAGVITLHPAAVEVYGPEAASEAVLVALEASARMLDTPGMKHADKTKELAKRVLTLAAGRLIDCPPELPFRRGATILPEDPTPEDIAAYHGDDLPEDFDHVVALGIRYEYESTDRPLSRGKPVLSASGHPSSLARLVDPVDEYRDTGDIVRERRLRSFQAITMATAAKHVGRRRSG